jgi:NAD(P)-dependent dehydrogenase (short-subunit alcohol dehydrogenase family)
LDLADLTTIKKSADEFLSKESRLNVLWNNAGVMTPPAGSKTVQGYELQLGTNCLGPFLFTQLLLPILRQTAASSPRNSVRVLFTASLMAELSLPKGGIQWEDINFEGTNNRAKTSLAYGQSKVGNIFLGKEFVRREGAREGGGANGNGNGNGVLFATLNPGNLKSELQRHVGSVQTFFGVSLRALLWSLGCVLILVFRMFFYTTPYMVLTRSSLRVYRQT